jgi:putative endonuclease
MEYFVYILISKKDGNFYTGYTTDLNGRIKDHNLGKVLSTKYRIPLELIYFEGCLNQADALHREKYLKTTYGKRFVRHRLKNFLELK